MNFESVFEAIQSSYNALTGEQKGLDWISMVMGHLEDAACSWIQLIRTFMNPCMNSFYQLEDASSVLRNELMDWNMIRKRLNEIEERLN